MVNLCAMKVLVIGGTGLISTAIVDQLIARGDDVTVYNRGVTPQRVAGDFKAIKGDRWSYAAFESEMKQHRFDAVIDMVAYAPENAESVVRAFAGRAKHLLVCSTVCVYGGPCTKLPATDDEPHRPVTGYGRNKSKIESIFLAQNGKDGTHTTVLRPSFTTGEGATANGVLFDDSTVSRFREGLPVIVHDDGKTPWAIAHVSDVARGFVNALLNEKAFGQSYHLTSDEHTTWDGVFTALAEAAGADPRLEHIPTDWLYDVIPRRSVGPKFIYQYASIFDNSKAARDLDFRTTVPLVETFRRQIAWMESTGKLKRVEEDRLQDILLDRFHYQTFDRTPEDYNPWGNNAEL
jgi:nucleoside-diphosphate-sugar epimerase